MDQWIAVGLVQYKYRYSTSRVVVVQYVRLFIANSLIDKSTALQYMATRVEYRWNSHTVGDMIERLKSKGLRMYVPSTYCTRAGIYEDLSYRGIIQYIDTVIN